MTSMRPILLAFALLAAACGGAPEDQTDGAALGETDDALSTAQAGDRADLATTRLIQRFWSTHTDYLTDRFPGNGQDAGYWIFAQAFDAVLDGVERTHGAKFKGDIARFYDAQERRGFKVGFFDDENWMALALIRAHDLTGERRYLDTAEELMADIIQNGWEAQRGIWWDRKHTSRATASNFGPVITAARLYAHTHRASYKTFAMAVYHHWYFTMVNQTTHQVADHASPDGKITWWKFTYNEGLAMGAATALHQITGAPGYLSNAHAFAEFMIHHEVAPEAVGPVLFDGDACSGDCDAFKGIGFRYLSGLYELDPTHTEYLTVLRASADAVWSGARWPGSTTFIAKWAGPARRDTTVASDASAVMTLNLAVKLEP